MEEIAKLEWLGEYGKLAGVVIAMVLAALNLPIVLEQWREVVPRRMRWLASARDAVREQGQFGLRAVLDREIESEVAFRLTKLRMSPTQFRQLVAINAAHPRAARWSVVGEWSDDIEFRAEGPYLTTGWFMLFLTYLMFTAALTIVVLGMLLLLLFAAIGVYTGEYSSVALHMLLPLGFTLSGIAVIRYSQSPYRWRKLKAAFDASLTPADAAAPEDTSG